MIAGFRHFRRLPPPSPMRRRQIDTPIFAAIIDYWHFSRFHYAFQQSASWYWWLPLRHIDATPPLADWHYAITPDYAIDYAIIIFDADYAIDIFTLPYAILSATPRHYAIITPLSLAMLPLMPIITPRHYAMILTPLADAFRCHAITPLFAAPHISRYLLILIWSH
jgi:hypothetical protein